VELKAVPRFAFQMELKGPDSCYCCFYIRNSTNQFGLRALRVLRVLRVIRALGQYVLSCFYNDYAVTGKNTPLLLSGRDKGSAVVPRFAFQMELISCYCCLRIYRRLDQSVWATAKNRPRTAIKSFGQKPPKDSNKELWPKTAQGQQ
jgi:hypothetical protein